MSANLAAALVAFQADMPTVKKSQTAKVPTKAGGSYSYTYAGLADVMREAMPVLTAHGLAFTALPRQSERSYELVGTLLHTSGEKIEGSLPIAGNTPQELGSSLTYMRRYLFGCLTGLVTDDDDDGQLAQKAATKPRAAKPAAPPPPPPPAARPEPSPDQPMQDKTRAAMFALLSERGVTERDAQIAGIVTVIGRPIESRSQLTEAEALAVIKSLRGAA